MAPTDAYDIELLRADGDGAVLEGDRCSVKVTAALTWKPPCFGVFGHVWVFHGFC